MPEPLDADSKPRLVRKARLRYEEVRKMDLLLLPERVVKLNPTGATILLGGIQGRCSERC